MNSLKEMVYHKFHTDLDITRFAHKCLIEVEELEDYMEGRKDLRYAPAITVCRMARHLGTLVSCLLDEKA